MKSKLFVLVLFALIANLTYSQTEKGLKIYSQTASGEMTQVDVKLSDIEKITFSSTEMTILKHDGKEVVYSTSLPGYIELGEVSGILTVESDDEQESIVVNKGMLVVKAAQGSVLRINDAKGVLVHQLVVSKESEEVSLAHLFSGVYFATVNEIKVKFVK